MFCELRKQKQYKPILFYSFMVKTIYVYRQKSLYKEIVDKTPYSKKTLESLKKRYSGVTFKII